MDWIQLTYLLMGLLLCLVVIGQLGFWTEGFWRRHLNRGKFLRIWQGRERRRLDEIELPGREVQNGGRWHGWREFRVVGIQAESSNCKSIYLLPADGKKVIEFQAGQHLTVRVHPPGETKPHVRCYSLSSSPAKLPYRISVKRSVRPNQAKSISVSNYINEQLRLGDAIECKAPSGDFVVPSDVAKPIVLLAAGVGITPLASMAQALTDTKFPLPVVLFYGNSNSAEHIFREELTALQANNPNLAVVNCYSNPLPGDRLGQHYHFAGRVSIELVKRLLNTLDVEFFLCGPADFMQTLHRGLICERVPKGQIHCEAFGPASIAKAHQFPQGNPSQPSSEEQEEVVGQVDFAKSGLVIESRILETILEIGEQNAIALDSGCRAGSCGTCAIRLISGEVTYPDGAPANVESGMCLACLARPRGQVVVDA